MSEADRAIFNRMVTQYTYRGMVDELRVHANTNLDMCHSEDTQGQWIYSRIADALENCRNALKYMGG